MDAWAALRLIDDARATRAPVLVGIGGHGAAGKSTLAAHVAGAQVVRTDEFWDGAAFDVGRLRHEVVEPLLAGRPARFSSWSWTERRAGGERAVEPQGVVIVEGVCALHRTLRDAYAVRIWVDAPAEVRLARAVAREGEEARATWTEIWLPREERYVEDDRPIEAAHLIVDGTAPLP
ncbi:MAG: uridine kinase family protein, partial [Gaiella sp.]